MELPIDRETQESYQRYALAAEYRGAIIDWSVHVESVLWDLFLRLSEYQQGPTGRKGPPSTTAMIDTLAGVFREQRRILALDTDDPIVLSRRQLVSNLRHLNSLRRLLVHGQVDTGVNPESVVLKSKSDVAIFAWWSQKPVVITKRRVTSTVRAAQQAAYGLGVEVGLAMR